MSSRIRHRTVGHQARTPTVEASVTLGLFAAWAVHDLEEVVAVPWWFRTQLPRLWDESPSLPVPGPVRQRLQQVDATEFAVAVSTLGTVVAAASVAGHRTAGSSGFYQTVLTGFGLHGVVHLAQAAALRRYTPGSVTSGVVVIPFTLWARSRLRGAGTLRPTRATDAVSSIGLTAAATAGAHVVARSLLRVLRTRRAGRTGNHPVRPAPST